ncbi:MAG: 3-phosphoshikimate 1-carboxyvinyltransferase [Elusimicrobium sp.]|jgi:3-phosphoshikimate 1-carboxyvinyltransferase|nr:3-phosphoshikimate 1-carboxyvinyltransferase [Elusimicrobium sp.]
MIIKNPLKPLNAKIVLGGSKSLTNRALLIASLAGGRSVIENASLSADSKILINALKKSGIKISGGKKIKISGIKKSDKKITINAGDAGTALRFLTAFCALTEKEVILTGSARMQKRPVGELVAALNFLGANIEYLQRPGFPPLKINKGLLRGGRAAINGGVSSQFISALLMLGPALKNGLALDIKGKLVSASYVDMTLDVMRRFGAKIQNKNYKEIIVRGPYKNAVYKCEPDASGASYFLACGALGSGGAVRVNLNPASLQGDVKFADILKKMGAKVTKGKDYIEVASNGPLKAVNADMTLMPDTAQTLAVLCAFARGKSKIKGLSTLRIKETDRIAALSAELAKMNVKTKTGKDFLEIYGGEPKTAKIKTYNDHRMAMAFAPPAAALGQIEILNPSVVKKSFPDFWIKLRKAGFRL